MARRKGSASFRSQLYRAARDFGNLHLEAAGQDSTGHDTRVRVRVVRRGAYRRTTNGNVWTGRVLRSIKF
jgi:hypothetical protein